MSTSAKLTPAARTSTTEPSPGSGTSSSASAPPTSRRTTAFTTARSPARPVRLPLLQERGDALLAVLGIETGGERLHLALVVPVVAGVAQERLDLPDRVRALTVERLDVARDRFFEVVDDELDEPPRLCRLGGNPLARHDQPRRAPARDQAGRTLRPTAARQQPQVD